MCFHRFPLPWTRNAGWNSWPGCRLSSVCSSICDKQWRVPSTTCCGHIMRRQELWVQWGLYFLSDPNSEARESALNLNVEKQVYVFRCSCQWFPAGLHMTHLDWYSSPSPSIYWVAFKEMVYGLWWLVHILINTLLLVCESEILVEKAKPIFSLKWFIAEITWPQQRDKVIKNNTSIATATISEDFRLLSFTWETSVGN